MENDNKVLVVIDMQNGFNTNEDTEEVCKDICELIDTNMFDSVVATKFINDEESPFCTIMNWRGMMDSKSISLQKDISDRADFVLPKRIYTCVGEQLYDILGRCNGGKIPQQIYIVGVDTDCCVLKSAVDLFEAGITPIVLAYYYASTGGGDSHIAGLKCLERLIGKSQIKYGKMETISDL